MKYLNTFFSLACVLALPLQAAELPVKDWDGFVEKTMQTCNIPGCAITIVQGDETVLSKGYGVREVGKPDKVDEHTLFAIASMSKSFTGAAAALAVQEKKFDWDTPIHTYFNKLKLSDPLATQQVTMLDLLTHRTGVSSVDCADWFYATLGPDNFWERLAHFPFSHGFRASWEYQNELYTAAGKIIEHVSGTPWPDYLRQRLFQPLGMNETLPTSIGFVESPNHATSHEQDGDKMIPVPLWANIDQMAPAAAIMSNAADMVPWLKLHVNNGRWNGKQFLSEQQLWTTLTPQAVVRTEGLLGFLGNTRRQILFPHSPIIGYGIGWFVHEYRGILIMQDPGLIDGMNSVAAILPGKNVGISILVNSGVSGLPFRYALLYTLVDAYFNLPPLDHVTDFMTVEAETEKRINEATSSARADRKPGTHPSLPLKSYEGTYVSDAYGTITLKLNGDSFAVIDSKGNQWGPLVHWQDDTFNLKEEDPLTAPTLGTFQLTADGKVNSLVFLEGPYKRKG